MSFHNQNWVSPPNVMSGFVIWCFDCDSEAKKNSLRRDHLNHDVDWVRRRDRVRFANIPDGVVPKAKVEDGF